MIQFSNDQPPIVQKLFLAVLDLERIGKVILKLAKAVLWGLLFIALLPAILVAIVFVKSDDYDGGNW